MQRYRSDIQSLRDLFGNKRKKSTLTGRVNKLQRRVDKKKRIAALKNKEASLRKQLRGF